MLYTVHTHEISCIPVDMYECRAINVLVGRNIRRRAETVIHCDTRKPAKVITEKLANVI